MAGSVEKLEGHLYKQGESVIGPLGKGFQKRWFTLRGNNLFYYKSKSDVQEQGFINLAEAILCQETENKDRREFQVNTPKRIWILQAETEDNKKYWIGGINQVINSVREGTSSSAAQAEMRIETLENRLRDSEMLEKLLRRALTIAAGRLSVTTDSLINDAEHEEEGGSGSQQPSEQQQQIAAATSAVAAVAAADVAATSSTASAVVETKPAEEPAAAPADNAESKNNESSTAFSTTATETKNDESKTEEAKAAAAAAAVGGPAPAKEPMKRFKARVLYDYNAQQDYEMTVRVDEVITVLSKHGNGWWLGSSSDGKQGYFPGSYVEPIEG